MNILSIDVEDWFHVENYRTLIGQDIWPQCDLRVGDNVERLLDVLAERDVRATFFVLGWVAARMPRLVERIASGGHEVASHGWSHAPIWALSSPEAFLDEVTRSRKILEDISGQAVRGYRAPTFSVTAKTLWALPLLAQAGYCYDSSIFPVWHDGYGIPDAPLEIHQPVDGLWEIPLSVFTIRGRRLPVAGGGYFRLYPRFATGWAIRQINAAGRAAVVYVHPWEFDPGQPRVPGMPRLRALRHHVGIAGNLTKLRWLLREFTFAPAWDVVQQQAAASPHLAAARIRTLADRAGASG